MDHIPQFWSWLLQQGQVGRVKIPIEIQEEISRGSGMLADWIAERHVKEALLLEEKPDKDLFQKVLNEGYQALDPEFNDEELQKAGRDPFLVAYALAETGSRIVVTSEVSKRTQRLGSSKLPDVCKDLKVDCINDLKLYRRLNFNLNIHSHPSTALTNAPSEERHQQILNSACYIFSDAFATQTFFVATTGKSLPNI